MVSAYLPMLSQGPGDLGWKNYCGGSGCYGYCSKNVLHCKGSG